MIKLRTTDFSQHALMVTIFCLAGWTSVASAQDTQWEKAMKAGNELSRQGRYSESENSYAVAVAEAEQFGNRDPRLAQSLNQLAIVHKEQAKYEEAGRLYQKALAICETVHI